jgi:hypothetical protein
LIEMVVGVVAGLGRCDRRRRVREPPIKAVRHPCSRASPPHHSHTASDHRLSPATHRQGNELGSDTFEATAVITEGAERDRLYRIVTGDVPGLNAYEQNTTRIFPVVVLDGVRPPT